MIQVSGTVVQGGLSVGPVRVLRGKEQAARRRTAASPAEELRRFEAARERAIVELRRLQSRVAAHWGDSESIIFLVQSMMLEDAEYLRSVRSWIERSAPAEDAVAQAGDELVAFFSNLDTSYMRARAADARDLSRRLSSILTGEPDWGVRRQNAAILCAEDLCPSETTLPDRGKLLGLVSRYGSPESHTAILARAIGTPALTDIPVSPDWDGKLAILDGDSGTLTIEPDRAMLDAVRPRLRRTLDGMVRRAGPGAYRTRDGRSVRLGAVVSSAWEATDAFSAGAQCVGLYRTDLFYTERAAPPSEEEQAAEYQNALIAMGGRPVTVQVPDPASFGDRRAYYQALRVQFRALLRSSVHGPAAAAVYGAARPSDLQKARRVLDVCLWDLEAEGLAHGKVSLGTILSTPAEVLQADRIASLSDFLTLDAHGLRKSTVQGAGEDALADYPAVLWMIRHAAEAAKRRNLPLSVYGNLSNYPQAVQVLVDAGVDELAVPVSSLTTARELIAGMDGPASPPDAAPPPKRIQKAPPSRGTAPPPEGGLPVPC